MQLISRSMHLDLKKFATTALTSLPTMVQALLKKREENTSGPRAFVSSIENNAILISLCVILLLRISRFSEDRTKPSMWYASLTESYKLLPKTDWKCLTTSCLIVSGSSDLQPFSNVMDLIEFLEFLALTVLW